VTELEELDLASPPAAWGELAAASRNVFGTPEWLALWWEHYERGRLAVRGVRDAGGRLVAVLPLYVWRDSPLRVVRLLGHGPGDELGPVCAPEDRPLAAAGLRLALEELRADALLAERLPGDAPWTELLGGRRVFHEASPVVDIAGRSWQEFLAERSSNFRDQTKRFGRKLAREHEVAVRVAGDPVRLADDVDLLFALHREQWPEGGSDFTGRDEEFQRAFASVAAGRGWLRLSFLEVDGEPVAASYVLRFGGVDADYQAGRATAWDEWRVGWVLLMHTLQDAFDSGLDEYRLMRGDEAYKYRLSTRDDGVTDVAAGRTPAGRAFALAAPQLRRPRAGAVVRALSRLSR
jgi:CelD/BcsL family acetyltransferase involved in cellulose biosynthesis